MRDFDVSRIVPSVRDLFGALALRRRALALVPRVDAMSAEPEAARLDDAGVRAVAMVQAGEAMQRAARATTALPMLCLARLDSPEACERARFFGADGVCLEARDAASWERLAKAARSTRMLALAHAASPADVTLAVSLGARAVLLALDDAAELGAAAARLDKGIVAVAVLPACSGDGAERIVRSLQGTLDALVVPAALHAGAGFASLLAELDPDA
jgi:hypothetical protein